MSLRRILHFAVAERPVFTICVDQVDPDSLCFPSDPLRIQLVQVCVGVLVLLPLREKIEDGLRIAVVVRERVAPIEVNYVSVEDLLSEADRNEFVDIEI